MIIKKFQGKTEEEAKELALKELGNGMVIMNVRTVKAKGLFSFFRKPLIELTAAIEEESDRKANAAAKQKQKEKEKKPAKPFFPDIIPEENEKSEQNPASDRAKTVARPMVDPSEIEKKIENLHNLIEEKLAADSTQSKKQSKVLASDEASEAVSEQIKKPEENSETEEFLSLIRTALLDSEVNEKYADELITGIKKTIRPGMSVDFILSNIYQKLVLMFGQAMPVNFSKKGLKIMTFIGPTGVGKTTTIAKIASIFMVNQKKKIALITTDTYRIAAADQLKTYATILNCPFRIVYTAEELEKAVDEFKKYDVILIDTAGHSPKNNELKEGTKQFLDVLQKEENAEKYDNEAYLVLSATTKYKDLLKIADMYKEMVSYKLIFTKLDETDGIGNLLNLKLYTKAAMSYVTFGQNVPDDIQVFNPQSVVRELLGGRKE